MGKIVPNHSAFGKRNPTGRIILPSGNPRTILAPIPGSEPSDSMRSSAALLEKKSASEGRRTLALLTLTQTISSELSSPEAAHGPIS